MKAVGRPLHTPHSFPLLSSLPISSPWAVNKVRYQSTLDSIPLYVICTLLSLCSLLSWSLFVDLLTSWILFSFLFLCFQLVRPSHWRLPRLPLRIIPRRIWLSRRSSKRRRKPSKRSRAKLQAKDSSRPKSRERSKANDTILDNAEYNRQWDNVMDWRRLASLRMPWFPSVISKIASVHMILPWRLGYQYYTVLV